ncbi:hypothetical protein CYMTET_22674 [Cymbomonas tetramitiformis]|uniref:Transcription initiation factor IIF subunit beta n=1 Tax=Cymbomonas tetramitiformis TaxID=36881 RepID=A0AAE0FZR8_9CHLO|nr:hypothetical protein CYMTET_22674 [Cymbomonas tetramitiformis]
MSEKKSLKDKLDVKKADISRYWLVKVPSFVKNAWQNSASRAEEGTFGPQFGKMKLTFDPCAQDSRQRELPDACLSLTSQEAADIPKDYDLKFQAVEATQQNAMYVFSQDPYAGNKLTVEGKVQHKLDCRPQSMEDATYNKISKDRINDANKKARTLAMLELRDAKKMKMLKPVSTSEKRSVKALGRQPEERRARLGKEELQDELFSLFERQSYWSFKQLVMETHQPAVWLKEVLQEVCRFNKRGPYADKWEVKPEYRHSKTAEAPAPPPTKRPKFF